MILNEYKKVCEDLLAIPVLTGRKTEKEKFAGALYTTATEAFTPEGKALQMGTSHNLGQGFAKVFGISYLGKDEKQHTPWQNSWGFSTRLIGAIVMMHGDDNGLVLPPKIAPVQIVIVPILFEDSKKKVLKKAEEIRESLDGFRIHLDNREEYTPGWKFNEWELKGVPLRIEIGPKDLDKNQAVLVRRDNKKKYFVKIKDLNKEIKDTLEIIHKDLFKKAKKFLDGSIVEVKNWNDFVNAAKNRKLINAMFCGNTKCENEIKDKTEGVTSRLIPFKQDVRGNCVHCGNKAKYETYFAKAY